MHRSDIVDELKDLGLTSYEAKSYVSLASIGPSEPRKVAKDSRVPYPSVYSALASLEEKGWVEQVLEKPVTYRAKRPSKVKAMVTSKLEDAFQALESIYRTDAPEEAELVYTLRGSDKVLSKIYELLRGAKDSVILVAPSMGLEDPKLLVLLEQALERGVKVRALGDEEAVRLLPAGAEIRTGNLVALDLLVDDKVALIGLPDYSAAGWIDSPAVATHFKQFLELLWSTSSPV